MRASPLVLGGRQRNKMQHPLTGATCVALPNVGMCPQLSCALTFMYLQQVRRALPSVAAPQAHGLSPRVAGLRFGTLEGFGRGLVLLDRRAASEPLIFRGPQIPRAQLFVPLCAYLENCFQPWVTGVEIANCLLLTRIFLVPERRW